MVDQPPPFDDPPPPYPYTAKYSKGSFVTPINSERIFARLEETMNTDLDARTPQEKQDIILAYIANSDEIFKNLRDPTQLSIINPSIQQLTEELEKLKASCGNVLEDEVNQLQSDTISKASWEKLYSINKTFCTRALISGIGTANAGWKATQGDMTMTPNKCGNLCHLRSKGWKEALQQVLNATKGNDILGYIASFTAMRNTAGFLGDAPRNAINNTAEYVGLDAPLNKPGQKGGLMFFDGVDITPKHWQTLDAMNTTYATRSIIQSIALGNTAWKKIQGDFTITKNKCEKLCKTRSDGWKEAIQTIIDATKNNNILGYLGLIQTGINNTGLVLDTAHNTTRDVNAVATSSAKTVGLLEKEGKVKPKKGFFWGGSRKRRNTRKRHTRRSKHA